MMSATVTDLLEDRDKWNHSSGVGAKCGFSATPYKTFRFVTHLRQVANFRPCNNAVPAQPGEDHQPS